ncbi:ribonuclease D [Rickettsiales endosymbiont of Peranema trichophorum]|nr:ribonuclease D [Rickettsiales endosymbiont of Peranema trichophorum]
MYHINDLPSSVTLKGALAIDTEAMGLQNKRDRLCVVQICDENNAVHIIHFVKDDMLKANYECPNLKKLLTDDKRLKIFHFARFDVAIMQYYLSVEIRNVYCTKLASRLARTYTDQHGLKDLCSELLGVKLSKQQQTSDWGAEILTQEQLKYAAHDVVHLHALREKLNAMLAREGRFDIASRCFEFIPARATLDILGWGEIDVFAYQ